MLSSYLVSIQDKVLLTSESPSCQSIKRVIWLYFLLIIFEGALRKWLLPGLATPLLIVRDPLAIWLIAVTWKRGLLPANPYITLTVIIGFVGIFTATLLGHGNLAVALFGARTLLIHFPLIFVIGRLFDRDDVIAIGKVTLWLAIPMVVLIAVQFYSPQSAWINRGVGGDVNGAGFSGALGFFRPPGTFSFTTGNASFFCLVAAFVLYFWLDKKAINGLVLIGATASLALAIPLSISRSLFFQVGISFIFLIAASARKPKYLVRILVGTVVLVLILTLLNQSSFFGDFTAAFAARFDTANESEGGLEGVFLDRFLGGLIKSLTGSSNLPFFGYGIGMGTNVGSMLLTGTTTFLIDEGEWGRIIGELGPLMGIGMVLIRLGLTVKISLACYKKLVQGDLLPWMLLSYGVLVLAQAGWSQPTSLGFFTLIGGLLIASLRVPQKEVAH